MLRPYQQTIYNDIRTALATCEGVCAVLPCRSGKSWIMLAIVESAVKKGNKVLILAHRNLLLNQHRELIKNCRLASVFTEVNHLGENDMPDLIIIDEAHISGAESYKKVCEYYKCKRILFTATAKRLDNKPLSLADKIINGISADELIEMGYISRYELYAPKLNIKLDDVAMSGADFNNEQISEIMLDKKIYGDIIKYYNLYANGKQAIAYCTNIKHSQSVCELFNSNGISGVHIDAKTSEKDRAAIMQDYKQGKYTILCNCNLISEGITLPDTDCTLLLRPTQSETLYIQQACRCLTPRPGKIAVIIDYVGNCFAHGTPTERREYSLTETIKVRNQSREPEVLCRQCLSCYKVYKGNSPLCPYCCANNGRTRAQIKQDEQAELERIREIQKHKDKDELKQASYSIEGLIEYGKKKNYHPNWAWKRWQILSKYRRNNGGINNEQ